MRALCVNMRGLVWIVVVLLAIPAGLAAQEQTDMEQADRFSTEELTQMLAPIALYPDALVSQILMASTYPLEVVEAERWLRENRRLKGEELNDALQEKPWDGSVKSLCHYPDLLFSLSDKLDQTRKLGDAFLSQQGDVMDTIQELRRRAKEQGNLISTKEQKVIEELERIVIEPADPAVVYVPVYNPLYVYGPWWYPAYPPYSWYYPPGVVITGGYISFGPAFFVGVGISSWAWFDWHRHVILIDVHKRQRFHKFDRRRDPDGPHWRHDPVHRRGVAYRDRGTSERFGSHRLRRWPPSPETRGYPSRRFEKPAGAVPAAPQDRPGRFVAPPAQGRDPVRERMEQRGQDIRPRQPAEPGRVRSLPGRDTPFRGIDSGSFERRASERGGESRGGGQMKQPGGEMKQRGGDPGRQRGGGEGGPRGSGRFKR